MHLQKVITEYLSNLIECFQFYFPSKQNSQIEIQRFRLYFFFRDYFIYKKLLQLSSNEPLNINDKI